MMLHEGNCQFSKAKVMLKLAICRLSDTSGFLQFSGALNSSHMSEVFSKWPCSFV